MTTLKLNKKNTEKNIEKNDETSYSLKPPVRRADPAKRDRTVMQKKVETSIERNNQRDQHSERTQVSAKPAETREIRQQTIEKNRQRNHKFDGSLKFDPSLKSDESHKLGQTQANDGQNLPINPEKKPKQAGMDTRTTPRPDKNEPQYRQAPRRGGKVRDGYDATATPQYGAAAKAAYKSTSISTDLPRLSKVMAERGLCSRREADEWISNGWVKVDGDIIETLGTRINPDAEIIISSYAQEYQAEHVTILLHKPVGYVSGQAEDDYQPAIVLVHPDNQWQEDPTLHMNPPKEFQRRYLHGLAPAGRLDIDSTGLLVLTQDGRIARHLIGEDSTVEKEYLVRVEGALDDDGLKRLNHGLSLDGEKLKPAKVSWQNEDQLRFVLREGKKRQIRRMCEMVGLHVVGLKRVRIGSINLGKLPLGEWRYLRAEEKF